MSARERLRLQPGPCRGCGGAEDDARRDGGRGGERPRDRRRAEDDGSMINLDGRLDLPDLLRLFRPAHAGHGRQVPERAVPPLRRHVDRRQAPDERRLLLRLHRHGPVPERHRRRPCHQDQEDRLRRRQADPAGAAQHQLLPARRALASIPTITCQVIFTGEWSLAVKEAEATNALVDQGADVITCHVDSPKVVVETAPARRLRLRLPRQPGPLAPEST